MVASYAMFLFPTGNFLQASFFFVYELYPSLRLTLTTTPVLWA